MPVPLVVPALAALAGAALSEELADDEEESGPPEWEIDVSDDEFWWVDDHYQRHGRVYVDLENRKITGAVTSPGGGHPVRTFDWFIDVGRVSGEDVRRWVEGLLPKLERGMDADEMRSDFLGCLWSLIRVIQTPAQVLDDLENNGRDRLRRLVLEKGVRLFDEDVVGVELDGGPESKAEAIAGWAMNQVWGEEGVEHTRDLPSEDDEVLALIGERVHGFDVSFDEDADRLDVGAVVSAWGLQRAVLPDGSETWRFLVRGR